jgi:hypothetical protein
MGTNLLHRYCYRYIISNVANDHLQLSARKEVTETTRLFKHEERYNHYNFWRGAGNENKVTVTMFLGQKKGNNVAISIF